jgi:xanthine dehydrogenase accessory factor
VTGVAGWAAEARLWQAEGRAAALVRVTDAAGLGARPAEELLLVDDAGVTAGQLLGGTLEPAVTDAARALLHDPDRRVASISFGVADEDAENAGLTCGGYVDVLVQRLDDVPAGLWDALSSGRPAALATATAGTAGSVVHRPGQPAEGTLGSDELDELARSTAQPLLSRPGHHVGRVTLHDTEVVVETWFPAPRLVIVGGSGLSEALVAQAALLGWPASIAVTHDEAMSAVDALGPADLLVVVDHDHDLATEVLVTALRGPASYVSALGSRHTQQERRARLEAAGMDDTLMARYHGPAGLDIGSRSPAEAAVSIVAEVLAERSGRSAAPLQQTTGRVSG